MSPFWNHILGFIYVEIAKIVATWKLAKLAKKNCIQVLGIWSRDQFAVTIIAVTPPTPLPPPSVAILFIYQTRIGYIRIHTFCRMYEFIRHRVYEFIRMNEFIGHRVYEFIQMNIFIGHRVYEFILFNVWIHIWRRNVWGAATSVRRERAAQAASVQRKPRGRSPSSPPAPTRLHPAAPTVRVVFGCPNQLGCIWLPQPVRVRLGAPIS